MKSLFPILILICSLFLSPRAFAAEVLYTAEMKGIECSGCKKAIAQSLGKIKGVRTIRITKTGEDQHQLSVITDGTTEITRADAIKALGKDSHYEIVSWSRG